MKLPQLLSTPALLPEELSDVAVKAVAELLKEGESQNTIASYRAALRYWAAWYGLRFGGQITLPVPAAAVMQFIVDHVQRTTPKGLTHELPGELDDALVAGRFKARPGAFSLNTVVHRLAVLSKAHQLREVKNPCQDAKVRELLAKTRRAYAKRGVTPAKKDALTRDPLQLLLATCDDSLRGLRDRALLLFAWSSGGRRRSEVADADMKFLRQAAEDAFTYDLLHSKTNQAGTQSADASKPLVGPAAVALRAWLSKAGISEGRIFRRTLKGGHLGGPLSPAAVRQIVKDRCLAAGLQGDFAAHSLRSGFVTEAGRQNISLADTMAMTGHRSVKTVLGYARSGQSTTLAAARLFEDCPRRQATSPSRDF